jgi:preprotein translocase subunit SecG
MLTIILTIFHVIVCLFLIFVVLLQQGNAADWSGAFGGGGSQTAFGSRGASTLLSKATTAAAIIFMITSLALTILISQPGTNSVIRKGAKTATPAPQSQPAAPATAPAAPAQGQQQTAPPATPAPQQKK